MVLIGAGKTEERRTESFAISDSRSAGSCEFCLPLTRKASVLAVCPVTIRRRDRGGTALRIGIC